jgi:hypothetical protein
MIKGKAKRRSGADTVSFPFELRKEFMYGDTRHNSSVRTVITSHGCTRIAVRLPAASQEILLFAFDPHAIQITHSTPGYPISLTYFEILSHFPCSMYAFFWGAFANLKKKIDYYLHNVCTSAHMTAWIKVNVYLSSLMMKVPDHLYVLGDTYTYHT